MQELGKFENDTNINSDIDWYKSLGSQNKPCDLRRLTSFIYGDSLGYMTLESRGEIKNRRCIQKVKTSVANGYQPQNITLNSLGCISSPKRVKRLTRVLSNLINRDKETEK